MAMLRKASKQHLHSIILLVNSEAFMYCFSLRLHSCISVYMHADSSSAQRIMQFMNHGFMDSVILCRSDYSAYQYKDELKQNITKMMRFTENQGNLY